MNLTVPIYLDNAATTKMRPEVLDAMLPFLKEKYGNPSSIHHFGREVKRDLEQARRKVAKLLDATTSEIFFTSGGTESINTAIHGLLHTCKHEEVLIITTRIEHHATLHSIEATQTVFPKATVHYISVDKAGNINVNDLEHILKETKNKKVIVCLMAANNEIGTMYDIQKIGTLCNAHNAIFICDMVQLIGHFSVSLKKLNVHIATASGHKFHAPKGIGMLYVNSSTKCNPFLLGGGQERNMRAGTENISGIIGFAKALDMQMCNLEQEQKYILSLKEKLKTGIIALDQRCTILGNHDKSLYSLINVAFPLNEKTEMLLYHLDMKGVAVSSGSACSSGTNNASHVIKELELDNIVPIRFSFSCFSTAEEIDRTLSIIASIIL